MAKKKRVRRIARRKIRHSAVRRVVHKPTRLVRSSGRKIRVVISNLIIFTILSLVSWILFSVSGEGTLFNNLFWLLTFVLGFVAIAFLIVLVELIFLKGMGK